MSEELKTLFVRGLSWYTDEHELRAYFEQFGPTEQCTVARDRETNKSRGFGFVTFETVEDAEKALSVEHELSNRTLYAQISIPRERPNRNRVFEDREMEQHKIYCGNLPESIGSMDLGQYFQEFAEVVDATVMMDRETGRSRGFGFVSFSEDVDPEIVAGFLENDHLLDGKSINVRMAFKRVENPRPVFGSELGGGGSSMNANDDEVDSGTPSMFRTNMPFSATPGWPGVTGVGSSFGGVRSFSTFSGSNLPAISSSLHMNKMQMNQLSRKPVTRINGSMVRNIMMKLVR